MNHQTMFVRKALLLLLLLLPMMAIAQLPVQTNLLTGYVGDYGVAPQSGINCTLTLVSPNPRTFNQTFITIAPLTVQSDTNGYFAFTNILWGNYLLSIQGQSYNEIFKIQVQTTTTNTTPLASLGRTFNPSWPNPQTNYYTMPQIDALLSALSAASGTGGVSVAALTGISAVTNGGLVSLSTPAVTNGDTRDISLQGKITGTNGAISFGPTVGITGNAESGSFSPALQMTRPNGAFSTVLLNSATNWLFGNNIIAPFFIGDGSSLSNYSATNLVGIIQTNSVRGAPTLGYVPAIQSDGYLTWVAQTGGGPAGAVTNNDTRNLNFAGSVTAASFRGNGQGITNAQYLPVVNVLLSPYNADPYNTVDSTAAFQAAINAVAAAGGGGVYVPSGVYKLGSTINLLPNNSSTDSGNIGGATNRVELFGDGQSSILITTANTTSPVFSYVGNGSAQVLWLHAHDLNMKGPFYTGSGHDNAGAITSAAYTSQGFFLGIPGVNTGTIGGAYSLFERMTIQWYNYGIVHSNWVDFTVRDSNIQMNKTGDILLAHSDSNLIENNFLGMTGQQNFCSNHFAIWIVGTNPALEPNADSGNGTVIINKECDGQILYGDSLVSLVYIGGDVEDASGNACPCGFLLTNTCNATFLNPHCNFRTSDNTNRFIFHLCNTTDGITVINPTFTGATGQRNNWFRIDRSDNVLYPPRLTSTGLPAVQENLPSSIDCLFNTNTWVVIPTADVAHFRNGSYPMEVGASQNLGVICATNTTKTFALDAYTATNGVNQVIGSGLTVAGADLGLMSYAATGSGNTLYFGKDYNDATKHAPDRIEFDYASVFNGPQNIAGYVDTGGALNWNHYIVPVSLLLNGGTAYMNGDTVAYGGSSGHGKMSASGVFYGAATGLTNFEATTYQTNLFTGGNNVDFNGGNYQFAVISGNSSVAGFANVPTGSTAGSVAWVCLSVSNSAATASTFSWPAGLVQFGTNAATSVSIPSGKRWKGTFSVDPQGTNLCGALQNN